MQKIMEHLKESRNPRNAWCALQVNDFSRSLVHEYHPPSAALFSVLACTKHFKIENKHRVY